MDQFTKEILTPSISQVLNVSAATNIYRVRLTDAMVSSLQFSKVIIIIIIIIILRKELKYHKERDSFFFYYTCVDIRNGINSDIYICDYQTVG